MEITVTKTATKLKWFMISYPMSNDSYWELRTNDDELVLNGNILIPQEIIDVWGTDDKVIEEYILSQITK